MKPVLLSPDTLELSIAFVSAKSKPRDFSWVLNNLASAFSETEQLTPNHPAVHRRHGAKRPGSDREIENAQSEQQPGRKQTRETEGYESDKQIGRASCRERV
jgi:hypothetical protein